MHFTPPDRGGAVGVPVALAGIGRRVFAGPEGPAGDAGLRRFVGDLAAPYGVATRPEVLARPHPTYAQMSAAMVSAVVGAEAPDLVVLAYAVPEVDPRRCVATHVHQVGPGDPFGFAVCDQGTASPFTALALAAEYIRSGAARRAVLVIAEQAGLPYATPPGTARPERDTAVALLLTGAGPVRLAALRQRPAVTAADVPAAVAAELAALPPGPDRIGVLGRDRVPPGSLATAPWWALADVLAEPGDSPHRTIVVDHEPALGYLSLLAVDTTP